MCLCVHVSAGVAGPSVSLCASVCVCMPVYISVCMHVHVHVHLCRYVYACMPVHVLRMLVCVYIHLYMSLCIHARMCICMRMCIHMCMCCLCVCISKCMSAHTVNECVVKASHEFCLWPWGGLLHFAVKKGLVEPKPTSLSEIPPYSSGMCQGEHLTCSFSHCRNGSHDPSNYFDKYYEETSSPGQCG